jgi:predicted metal-dependent RNase
VLGGFSAHADQRGLADFAREVANHGELRRIVLVHGEPPAQAVLADLIRPSCARVDTPAIGERSVLQ